MIPLVLPAFNLDLNCAKAKLWRHYPNGLLHYAESGKENMYQVSATSLEIYNAR